MTAAASASAMTAMAAVAPTTSSTSPGGTPSPIACYTTSSRGTTAATAPLPPCRRRLSPPPLFAAAVASTCLQNHSYSFRLIICMNDGLCSHNPCQSRQPRQALLWDLLPPKEELAAGSETSWISIRGIVFEAHSSGKLECW